MMDTAYAGAAPVIVLVIAGGLLRVICTKKKYKIKSRRG
jgi:hypothetical protein